MRKIVKRWWFWLIVPLVLVGAAGSTTSTPQTANNNTAVEKTDEKQLPRLNKYYREGEEGLVVYKDLVEKGYNVSVDWVHYQNSQDLTEQFKSSDVKSCADRLGFDAYVVSFLQQNGNDIRLHTTIVPNSNQQCPDGTINDI